MASAVRIFSCLKFDLLQKMNSFQIYNIIIIENKKGENEAGAIFGRVKKESAKVC